MFRLVEETIEPSFLRRALAGSTLGGFVSFEGWVRDHNQGKAVRQLEYEAYVPLALKEGERIIDEARRHFSIENVLAVHRIGHLAIGDVAVWVGAASAHRDAAFQTVRYVIDAIKMRVPIWKREEYADGSVCWVNCAACGHLHPG